MHKYLSTRLIPRVATLAVLAAVVVVVPSSASAWTGNTGWQRAKDCGGTYTHDGGGLGLGARRISCKRAKAVARTWMEEWPTGDGNVDLVVDDVEWTCGTWRGWRRQRVSARRVPRLQGPTGLPVQLAW